MYVGCGGFLVVFTFSILFGGVQAAKQRWRVIKFQQAQKDKSRKEIEKRIHSIPFFHSTLKLALRYFVIDGFFLPASNTGLLKGGPLEARQEVVDDY